MLWRFTGFLIGAYGVFAATTWGPWSVSSPEPEPATIVSDAGRVMEDSQPSSADQLPSIAAGDSDALKPTTTEPDSATAGSTQSADLHPPEDRLDTVDTLTSPNTVSSTDTSKPGDSPAGEPGPAPVSTVAAQQSASEQWASIWRPFRSERTASGFAEYIGEATGLTLRVAASESRDQYRVEVRYQSDTELQQAVERVVQTTGYRPVEPVNVQSE